ncbi:MAG: hypothetical protein EAZ30_08805 [Betaproteobacteria bacterium]|nr:MAG: hypothetical protein EAZ30_08805 [Betaproteobacteria bacterium]
MKNRNEAVQLRSALGVCVAVCLGASGVVSASSAPVMSSPTELPQNADTLDPLDPLDEATCTDGAASMDRQSARSERASDEAVSSNVEAQRAISEATRAAKEAIRSGAEAARAGAESARAAGEAARAALASADFNEIRDAVRRSLDSAGRGNISIRISDDTPQRGNPYSARETREFKQVLSDGTVISRQSTRLLARDGEGRTRQELRQPDGTARVFINDPVAKTAIIFDPQKRTACKSGFDKDAIHDCFHQMRGDWKPLGFAFDASSKNGIPIMGATDDVKINVSASAKVIDLTAPGSGQSWSHSFSFPSRSDSSAGPVPPVPPVPPLPPPPPLRAEASKDSTAKREKVTQLYEGLRVDVDKSVESIAAGAIGNNRAIESISERFYSPDLKMVVFSRRSDPRSGEAIYRMTEIKRAEPDAAMFRMPEGVTELTGKRK